ncbi:MAG: hypothetical protein IJI73_08495 [Kiritimatiellae bacterium]|nr:hypothetical protein [Kiritimatiellia bacterium]
MKNAGFLQNMAPNAQRSFFVSIAIGAIAVVLYMFGVEPAQSALVKDREKLEQLHGEQNRINRDLKGAENVKKNIADLNGKLKPYKEAMLTPLLGSYSMRAKTILDPIAIGAGLTDIDYAKEDFRALPVPKPTPRQLYTRAAVRLTAKGSYQRAISFLMRLEKEMPLVSLQSMEIDAQQHPTKQIVTFVLEWPAEGGLTRK